MADGMAEALRLVALGVFETDDEGRVWRRKVNARGEWQDCEPRRAESEGNKGYLRLVMGVAGRKTVSTQAHRLVYTVKVGPIPDGMEINHINLDKRDNRPCNLETVTGAQNISHARANGCALGWSKATEWRGRSRLSLAQVEEIRRRRASGESTKALAAEFDRHPAYIWQLCKSEKKTAHAR